MKKQFVLLLATGIMFLFFQSFNPEPTLEGTFPDEITAVLKTSCYDCHFTGSNSDKALNAVNFDKWDDYRLTKQIGLLGDIAKVVEKGKMPPEKYLEHKPAAKLSEAQQKLFSDWTSKEAEKLMQGD